MVFIAQPSDVVVMCASNESAEFKCQHTLGSEAHLVWIINSTAYGYGYMDFLNLENHAIVDKRNGTVISVKNIQNNTIYQCQLEVYHQKISCTYKSTIGRLILRGCDGKY